LFKVRKGYRWATTESGGNFHCCSVPKQLIGSARKCEVELLHLGYMDREDRKRKYEWYNRMDPNNGGEDHYRHMIQGDVPEIPAGEKLLHAGPLQLRELN
jgi:hypothetical protein